MLKHGKAKVSHFTHSQPPSGGCVLKLNWFQAIKPNPTQPPSGGCVLKHQHIGGELPRVGPAAFGRLCVETLLFRNKAA